MHDDIVLERPERTHYNMPFLRQFPTQLARELAAYRIMHGTHGKNLRRDNNINLDLYELKSPLQHMVNIIQLLWPNEFLLVSQGIRNNYALDVLWALCNHKNVGIAGAASTGKTRTLAAWAVADWLCAPECTTTFVASTDLEGSRRRIWGDVETLYRDAMRNCQKIGSKKNTIGDLISYKMCIAFTDPTKPDDDADYGNVLQCVAFPKGDEGRKAIVKVQGSKNKRVRLLVDELAEMDPYVNDARINLRSNPDVMYIGIANPANTYNNPHKDLCAPSDPRGWSSVNPSTHMWETTTGIAIHLSGMDSPNYRALDPENPPYEFYQTEERRLEILRDCQGNENHLLYWRMVHGWWPDSSVELNVISRATIAASQTNKEPRWMGPTRVVAGFDTGFTAGGDRCPISFARVGREEGGRMVGFYLGTREVIPLMGEEFETSIAKQVVKTCIELGVSPEDFGMDISSDGGKVMRAIIQEWIKFDSSATSIYPISSSGAPSDRTIAYRDSRKACDVYDRRITEICFLVHEAFITKAFWGLDLTLHKTVCDQLTERIYSHKGKKLAVETKREMKDRIKRSPDEADSLNYCVVMMTRAGVEFVPPTEEATATLASEIRDFENRMLRKESVEEETDEYAYVGAQTDEDDF